MEQSWFPTHLRVTVIGARHLRAKGKDGLNDCYTVIRLGSDKYMTSVQSGTLSPEWKEECTLQLPLVLDNSDRWTLHLTVKHNNSRLPVDAFLGHVALPIAHLYEDKSRRRSELGTCELSLMAHATKPKYDGECICVTDHGRLGNPFCYTVMWYDLQSKPNKAAKNRGQLQLAFEFLRNNTTASSYELFKRRPQSVFDKFKDKVTSIKYGMTHEILPSEKPSTANGSYSGAPLAPSSLKHHKNGKMSKSLSYAQMDSRAEMLNAPGIGTQTGSEVLSLVFHKHSGDEQPKVHLKMADVHTDSADQSQSDKIATLKLEEASVLKLHSNNVEHMFPKCATEADRSYVSATHSSPLEKTKPRHFEDNPRLASFVIAGGGRDVSFEGWKVKPTTCCTHCFHQANSKSR